MRAVIFDLDGTLLDTIEDIRAAVNYGRRAFDGEDVPPENMKTYVGRGLYNALKQAIINHGPTLLNDDELSLIYQLMMEYYRKHPADLSTPYDGVMELLKKLADNGIKMGILSNKSDELIQEIVLKCFPDIHFEYVQGQRSDLPLKPDPAALYLAIDSMGVDKSEVVYVGDSEVDYKTAQNSGVKSVIVNYGFRTKAQLEEAGCTVSIDHVPSYEELLNA